MNNHSRELTIIFSPLTTRVVAANASIKRWQTMEVESFIMVVVMVRIYCCWSSTNKIMRSFIMASPELPRDDVASDPWIFRREPESPCGRSRWRWIFRWTTQHQFLCESKAQFTDAKVTWGKCSKTPQKEKGRKRKILFVSSVDWGFAEPWEAMRNCTADILRTFEVR